MTNGKRNRAAGHEYERDIVKILKEAGFVHACTSRAENRNRDAQKIDICNKDELVNGRLPLNIQCKNTTELLKYDKLLSELPKGNEINALFHRRTKRSQSGRFITSGEFVILNQKDFLKLIKQLL